MVDFSQRLRSTAAAALLVMLTLPGCGGGGGGADGGATPTPTPAPATPAGTYTVGGTATGLTGTLVLQNKGGDDLSVNGGTFTFATPLAGGGAYDVTILTQPDKQRCFVTSGAGTSGANVSNISIACASQMGGAMQGVALNLAPTVSTLAGTADPAADGVGAAARFSSPYGVVSDGLNLFVADWRNSKIRKVVIATGAVSTLAGSTLGDADGIGAVAQFKRPSGIAIDSTGANLYVADMFAHRIRKIVIATGAVSTLAGSGAVGATDATGTAASFNSPFGITIDSTDSNLYVADSNNLKIRKIVLATAAVSSFTGAANTQGSLGAADGAGTAASFRTLTGITNDGSNLYVADLGNAKIRAISIATQVVSSVTGDFGSSSPPGATDGANVAARLSNPYGITTDGVNLYVADAGNNKIRVVALSNGATSSLTGTANTRGTQGFADGTGAAATFSQPLGVTAAGGKLYVADHDNNTIRSIAIATAEVTTLAGNANPAANGTGAVARFIAPRHLASDGTHLYVADTGNHIIRKITIASEAVSTLAGSGAAGETDGTGAAAQFNAPQGITTDGSNVYVTDTLNNKIRQIAIATGVVTTLAGGGGAARAADGTGPAASFASPNGITTDGVNLYVADWGNNKIRKIVIATGAVTSQTGAANVAAAAGSADGAGAAATFNGPQGITTDGTHLYVADTLNRKIRKIVIATGAVSSLTGAANATAGLGVADGSGTLATFAGPVAITTDGTHLYVVDTGNNKVRKIVIATAVVSSLTGAASTATATGFIDGTGAAATFNQPSGITSDGANLFVSEVGNSVIRKIK